jgi:queuine tRNA-ribosyltransferase
MGTQIILGNTYHLNIRPGLDIIRAAGGLHKFMNWEKPILTDSGGFQVFSLAKIRKIKPHGVEFRSHLDGSLLFLGPKEAMEIQRVLGSDIAMVFDECPPHDAPAASSASPSNAPSAGRANAANSRARPAKVFGIVQGGSDAALREECAKALVAMDFDGYAIGGVSVGEPEPEMMKAVEFTEPHLPANKARYAMGLGTPAQMVELSRAAWTCSTACCPRAWRATARPSRGAARSASRAALTRPISGPIEEGCECLPAAFHARLSAASAERANEILGLRMVSVHNSHCI